MISTEEIKRLADLARIEILDDEAEKLGREMDSILEYVGQIKEISGEAVEEIEIGENFNVWREDVETSQPGEYSKELIAEFPDREGDYLKVKKIL